MSKFLFTIALVSCTGFLVLRWFLVLAARRDTLPGQVDLPRDPHPNPATYQSERRELQAAYIAARKSDGHVRWNYDSDIELENAGGNKSGQ